MKNKETKFPENLYDDNKLFSSLKEVYDIEYAFNEDNILEELKTYIDKTYSQHYAQDRYQAMDIIMDSGHGMGFALGNVIKYAKRYGKKNGHNRDDIMKLIHYGILALAVHDLEEGNDDEK